MDSNFGEVAPRENKKKIVLIGIAALVAVLIISGVVAFFSKFEIRRRSGVGASADNYSVGAVCGDETIEMVNKILNYDEDAYAEENIISVVSEIMSKNGYENDANCLNAAMLVSGGLDGIISSDQQKDMANRYIRLIDKGVGASLKMSKVMTYEDADRYIKSLDGAHAE